VRVQNWRARDPERGLNAEISTRTWFAKQCATLGFFVVFLIYPTVCQTIFGTFSCETLDDGVSYLERDYSIVCNDEWHTLFQLYAAGMALVYPIGVPLMYLYFYRVYEQQIHLLQAIDMLNENLVLNLRMERYYLDEEARELAREEEENAGMSDEAIEMKRLAHGAKDRNTHTRMDEKMKDNIRRKEETRKRQKDICEKKKSLQSSEEQMVQHHHHQYQAKPKHHSGLGILHLLRQTPALCSPWAAQP